MQIALIEALTQRADLSASAAIAASASSTDADVRVAAIHSLGLIGDASHIQLLVDKAANARGTEQKVARQSLIVLPNAPVGKVTDQLLALISSPSQSVQVEAVRAIGGRADRSALPQLLALAHSTPDSARPAVFQALASLAGAAEIPTLTGLVIDCAKDKTKAEPIRNQASQMLKSACQRLQSQHVILDFAPIIKGISEGNSTVQVALLSICGELTDPAIAGTLRQYSKSADAEASGAAIRALCETHDITLLPDLLKIARENSVENYRILAIRGGVRLATAEEAVSLSNPQRVEALKSLLESATRSEEQRLVLGGLSGIPEPLSLELALKMVDKKEVQVEAAQSVTKLAGIMAANRAETSGNAVKKVLATPGADAATRTEAQNILNRIEAMSAYITAWDYAGPYTQAGKDYLALFDVPFAPETKTGEIDWKPMPASTDKERPWLMDLLKVIGGEQRIAYVRSYVYSSQEQSALIELGSDDGVKVWWNEKLVHTNNATRGLTPGSDKINVTLKQGWNPLMLKVTQYCLGWEYCVRIVKPDGSKLPGLKYEAKPENTTK